MPIVLLPDGSRVKFPDTMSEAAIQNLISRRFPAETSDVPGGQQKINDHRAAQQHPEFDGSNIAGYNPGTGMVEPGILDTVGDVAASGAAGIGRGTMDLVGLPGTIAESMEDAGQWGLRKGYELATGEAPLPDTFFGGPSEKTLQSMPFQGRNPLSGSVLREGLAKLTGGASDYRPRTTLGEYAGTFGEFVPSAAAFGGAGAVNLLRGAIVPALTSETAGQLTKGTKYEPYVRAATALLSSYGASKIGRVSRSPSLAEVEASSGGAMLEGPMKSAQLDRPSYYAIVKGLWDEAKDFGPGAKLKSEVKETLGDFLKGAENGSASYHDLELLSRTLNKVDPSGAATVSLSRRLTDRLADAVADLPANDARDLYLGQAKSRAVGNAVKRADEGGSDFAGALRTELRELNDSKMARHFSEAERQSLRGAAGSTVEATARRWAAPLANTVGVGAGNALGTLIGTPFGLGQAGGAFGGALAKEMGNGAKSGADAFARRQAAIAGALMKANPAVASQYRTAVAGAQQSNREAMLRAVLQSLRAYQAAGNAAEKPGQYGAR